MTDRSLEDAIFHLRRMKLDKNVHRVVDEAAQLVSEGRQIEAAALIEKAEAMSVPNGPPEEKAMHRVTEKLAVNLAGVLTSAFQELEDHLMDEGRKLNTSLQQQLEKLQSTVEGLGELRTRFDQLTDRVARQEAASTTAREQHGQLSAEVGLLRQAESRQGSEIAAIRHRADEMSSEINRHDEELDNLKAAFSESKDRISAMIDRIDRQAEVIRFLHDAETKRANALEQALEVFAQLKTPLKVMAQSV
jgi:chromosome segregation ATPase